MSQVLLIDPSALCQELVSLALRSNGFAIETCVPTAALETIEAIKPRLLIYEPGGMEGLHLLRQLQSTPRHKETSVIILTDAATRELVLETAKLGVRDFMLKSRFSQAELLT